MPEKQYFLYFVKFLVFYCIIPYCSELEIPFVLNLKQFKIFYVLLFVFLFTHYPLFLFVCSFDFFFMLKCLFLISNSVWNISFYSWAFLILLYFISSIIFYHFFTFQNSRWHFNLLYEKVYWHSFIVSGDTVLLLNHS